ncbi:MAG: KOW domain-containing RNA-binding protein [Ruminococcus sp.]|nr:KOW domain-containing RNA-binding protein [Ruminococcus sp.]
MELTKGLVVRAKAGRDQGGYFVVLSLQNGFAEIADGKRRKIEKPKRKNVRHLQGTKQVLNLEGITNKQLRNVLKQYQTDDFEETVELPELGR